MREMMSLSEGRKIPTRAAGMEPPTGSHWDGAMHPDDYEAHLAWVMAKRFHELVLKETFPEKPVYYRIIG